MDIGNSCPPPPPSIRFPSTWKTLQRCFTDGRRRDCRVFERGLLLLEVCISVERPHGSLHSVPGLLPLQCNCTPQALLQADLGATTSFQIIEDLRLTAKGEDRKLEPDDIKAVLRATLIQVTSGTFQGPLLDQAFVPVFGIFVSITS